MAEIVMTQTPPILHGPSDKERKYDRQLRLWAASGQAALESANILLLNSGAGTVGVETLKNLVLPGIGQFTIADREMVNEADLGVNFFLDQGCLGKPRAEACAAFLQELNPDVQSSWCALDQGESSSLEQFLNASEPFTIIVYTAPISKKDLAIVKAYSEQHKTPLFAVHSTGFYSYFRIFLPGTFPIIDTHPDETATTDLRLLKPWAELETFAKSLTENIEALDDHKHGHIPYIAILLRCLDDWRESHAGAHPTTYKDKTEFRKTVQAAARTNNAEGGEENFDEAAAAVLKTIIKPSLPSGVKEVFQHQCPERTNKTSSFWIIAEAIKRFYDKHQELPLPGNVPDMKAESQVYIALQNIYKAKARQDALEVLETAKTIAPGHEIDPIEVDLFCKNAAFVKLVNARTGGSQGADRLAEVAAEEIATDKTAEELMMPPSLFPVYLALQAASHATTPTAEDIVREVESVLPNAGEIKRLDMIAQEVARAEGGELHNISALTGGMVAQEMIKIITKQYIPIDNTCVFDGIASRTQVFHL